MRALELGIAWRYLRSRRGSRLLSLISVISIGGVIVGVSALIVIIGVMNGLQTDLREKILIGSPDIRVLTFGEDLSMSSWRSTLARVKKQGGVRAAAPFVHAQALVNAGHVYGEGTFVMGIEPDHPGLVPVTSIRRTADSGDFSFRTSSGDTNGVVIGVRLADRLNVHPGSDSVSLLSTNLARIDPVTGQPVPNVLKFEVSGIFETGMYEYDNAYIFMSLASAQRLAQLGQSVTGIEVRTSSREAAPQIASALADTLGFPYRTEDWQKQNSSLFHALKLEKLGMAFILLLIVLVAAFNIVSTLTMVVTDKTREIGILRAMGMPAQSIRRIFFTQGVVIGLVGTMIGLLLGLATSVAIDHYKLISLDPSVYFIDHLPVAMDVGDVLLIVLASLLIAALATLYPARQAARLYPVEAIRHE
jgi:lipoprotein-releasing system permease protein